MIYGLFSWRLFWQQVGSSRADLSWAILLKFGTHSVSGVARGGHGGQPPRAPKFKILPSRYQKAPFWHGCSAKIQISPSGSLQRTPNRLTTPLHNVGFAYRLQNVYSVRS